MREFAATLVACVLVLGCAAPAGAAVGDYLGKPIVAVRLVVEDHETTDTALTSVVETFVGRPLSMADVRASITHLFSLGRFEDVRVDATTVNGGVALRYDLVPIHPVTRLEFAGRVDVPGVGEGLLRRAVLDRAGGLPEVGRAAELARTVHDLLASRGYLRATIAPRAEVNHAPDRTTLVFTVDPGPRATITRIAIVGRSNVPPAELLKALRVHEGAPYERQTLDASIDRYVAERRRRGYYEASVSAADEVSEDGASVALTLTVNPGPHVKVAFSGDPLPDAVRADLVPVEREGSVDEDLLEDSTHRIEEFLHGQGYRDAAAPHARTETDGELVITFAVRKGPLYRVSRVDISGNASVPLTDFEPSQRLRDGTPFSEARLDADAAAIEEFYRRAGFPAAKVDQAVDVEAAPGEREVPVVARLSIREGVRTIVSSVRFSGNRVLSDAQLREGLSLQPDRPFVVAQLATDRDALETKYANLGFGNATVDGRPEYTGDATRADVVFTIREGPQIIVDHVLIVGNARTSRQAIERELQLKSGDPLGRDAIYESQRRLAALGLFRRVNISALPHGEETRRDLLVTVEEAPATTIAYGGGVEGRRRVVPVESQGGIAEERFELAPRASFEIGRRNLFGSNRSANLFSSVSVPLANRTITESGTRSAAEEYRLVGTFREPRVFATPADALVNVTFEQQIRSSFSFRREGASAEVGHRVSRSVSLSGSYQIERTNVFDLNVSPEDQRLIDRTFTQVRVSSFSASIIRDTRDDQVDPTGGGYLSANGQLAARRIGSEVGFVKSFFRAQAFRVVPHTRQIVFAANASFGLATGFPQQDASGNILVDPVTGEPVRDLPQSERFYAGGDTTVRGFALDTLGVRHTPPQVADTIDPDGFPIGGNALLILNGELRMPAWRGVGVVGFVDSGNVFARAVNIDIAELRTAAGVGLRYKSPVGPIRVDLGFKVNRRPDENLTAWFITFGQAF